MVTEEESKVEKLIEKRKKQGLILMLRLEKTLLEICGVEKNSEWDVKGDYQGLILSGCRAYRGDDSAEGWGVGTTSRLFIVKYHNNLFRIIIHTIGVLTVSFPIN